MQGAYLYIRNKIDYQIFPTLYIRGFISDVFDMVADLRTLGGIHARYAHDCTLAAP